MIPRLKNLDELVSQVSVRINARRMLRGAAITLLAVAVTFILVAVFGGKAKAQWLLILLRLAPLIVALPCAWFLVATPLRSRPDRSRVARLIEEKCGLGDRLITSVEYGETPRKASPAIIDRLIADTTSRTASVSPDIVVDPRVSYAYGAAIAVILLLGVGTLFFGPSRVTQGMASIYGMNDGTVAANSMFIAVTPGSTRVPRGSDLKLKATLNGFDSSLAQLFVRKTDADSWQGRAMEPAKNAGEFQTMLFNMQDSMVYYVESEGLRSTEFTLEVADLPFVKQIDLVLTFPAYTRLPEKRIENAGEIAAVKGTVAHVIANMSAEAKNARIVLNDGTKIEMTPGPGNQFLGQITVKQSGTYRIEMTGPDGQPYNGSNEYDITSLEDHAPTVMIDKPGRDMKVTSIQEVFTQVRAEDDYGVSSIELHFSVNGGEEKIAKLQDQKSETPRSLIGAQTFFLEEYGLKPGDFISYYAVARDNSEGGGRQSTSDIYFLEVRPFDREFRQAQQQGGQGQGDQESNALTRRQREIIAATFRVQREQETYTPKDKDENFGAVSLSQEKLKTDTDALAERIRRRLGDQLQAQKEFAELVDDLTKASKEMDAAIVTLRAKNAKDSLPPEQRSLQQLLRAEAIFREMQIARGQSGQGSQQEQQQELADLFELQLDKMKNQYETVQREQQTGQNQQEDEIARKLKELARREQQQMEGRMRSEMQQGGGGGGGSQRQQQETIEEAQKMARELERLSRDRRDPKLAEAARQMQQAVDEMRRAQASQSDRQNSSRQSSSGRGNQEATAQQLRALERLEQARRILESAQRQGGQQSVQRLTQQAEDALRKQDEISKAVDDLARNSRGGQGQGSEQKKQQIGERKQALADQLSGLENSIDQTARGMGSDRQQAADKLREAAGAIRSNRIPDRIRQNQQLIENGWMDQAREREGVIRKNIEQVLKNLQGAQGSANQRSEAENLEDALNRARDLADSLESLKRRIESQRGDQGQQGQQGDKGQQAQQAAGQGKPQGQQNSPGQQGQQANNQRGKGGQRGQQTSSQSGQQGQQKGQQGQQGQDQQAGSQQGQQGQEAGQQAQGSGQRQGKQGQRGQRGQQAQQGQEGQQSGQQQGQQAGGQQSSGQRAQSTQGSRASGPPDETNSAPGGPPTGGDRQLESELRQRIAEAEDLKRQLGKNPDLAKDLNRAIEQLRRINPNAFSDPSQLAALKNEVIDPLRQLEIELARKLQAKLGNTGAGALSDGDAPDRYKALIEDYYKRLSSKSPDARQQ